MITLVMEKWCDLNPILGTTSANSNLVGSLSSSGLPFEVFYYDEYLLNNYKPIDEFLINHCKETKPEALAVCYYPVANDSRNIKKETFAKILKTTPIIFIWFDFIHQHIKNIAFNLKDVSTLHVVVDTYYQDEKTIPMWVPQDTNLFSFGTNKDIDVCFVGSRNGYGERYRYLDRLPRIQISGGQREHRLSIEEYANLLKRAQISLNFPSKPDGSEQAKSRIYESMLCGAMLMERENECIKKWFTPMKHYVPFNNEDDFVNKIEYYSKNEEERSIIAKAGYDKMISDYNSSNWWRKICEKVSARM
jgi:hypothetical protein